MTRIDSRLLSLANFHVFCTLSIVAIIFIVNAHKIIYGNSERSLASNNEAISPLLQNYDHNSAGRLIKSDVSRLVLHSMQDETIEVGRENTRPLVPPFNVTEEERIAWFRSKLPEFHILKSDKSAKQFHGRVLEFFNKECEGQFFMTWISPARSFGSREFLTTESLFKAHPRGCLMIISRSMDSKHGYRILKPLQDSGFKVHAVTPDLSFLFNNTPAKTWFAGMKRGNRDPGLRNSIGAQSVDVVSKNWTRLNNAVLIFDANHPLLHKFMKEFALTFDGNKWGHNGPYLVSRVVLRVQNRPGYNFTILPPLAFYPVDWNRIGGLFKKPGSPAHSRWIKAKLLQLSGETYGVHLWNKQSSREVVQEGSIMQRLMSDHCIICNDI
ncbi:uncharacterized protein At4g19900-like isoform X2 [Malus sylvestris]|uniref:uncharacterized protein At4g19900-like isoform X2 n=1 Tax=Malus sylvestris TaxID=3752 RepID=UPI0021AC9509|nr:uncharacterized protein At4g19900-like isoform X2 [Malus sylvestris]